MLSEYCLQGGPPSVSSIGLPEFCQVGDLWVMQYGKQRVELLVWALLPYSFPKYAFRGTIF